MGWRQSPVGHSADTVIGVGEPVWISSLKKVLQTEQAQVSTVLITHWHHDHVGGISDLQAYCPEAKVYKNSPSDGILPIEDGQVFQVDGATLTAHYTPGHTTDHMTFFLSEEGALFTGDNVLGHGTSVFEDLGIYVSSLKKMLATEGLNDRAYPGHGEVIDDAKGAIATYIAHRKARERQVLKVLKEGHPLGYDDVMTAMEIVEVIYKDIPRELYPRMWQIEQILEELVPQILAGRPITAVTRLRSIPHLPCGARCSYPS